MVICNYYIPEFFNYKKRFDESLLSLKRVKDSLIGKVALQSLNKSTQENIAEYVGAEASSYVLPKLFQTVSTSFSVQLSQRFSLVSQLGGAVLNQGIVGKCVHVGITLLGGYAGMKVTKTDEKFIDLKNPLNCYVTKFLQTVAATELLGLTVGVSTGVLGGLVGFTVGALAYNARDIVSFISSIYNKTLFDDLFPASPDVIFAKKMGTYQIGAFELREHHSAALFTEVVRELMYFKSFFDAKDEIRKKYFEFEAVWKKHSSFESLSLKEGICKESFCKQYQTKKSELFDLLKKSFLSRANLSGSLVEFEQAVFEKLQDCKVYQNFQKQIVGQCKEFLELFAEKLTGVHLVSRENIEISFEILKMAIFFIFQRFKAGKRGAAESSTLTEVEVRKLYEGLFEVFFWGCKEKIAKMLSDRGALIVRREILRQLSSCRLVR